MAKFLAHSHPTRSATTVGAVREYITCMECIYATSTMQGNGNLRMYKYTARDSFPSRKFSSYVGVFREATADGVPST